MKSSLSATTAAAVVLLAASQTAASGAGGANMLAPRQTSVDATLPTETTGGPCMSSADSILSGAPLPTDMVLINYFTGFFATATGLDPCQITDVPSSVSSAYLAYSAALSSWSKTEYAAAQSFAEQGECQSSTDAAGEVLQLLTAVDIYMASGCPGASGTPTPAPAPTSGPSTTGSGTGSGTSSGTGGAAGATTTPSTTAHPGAGARVTQGPFVVLAAAGAVAAAVAMV